MSGMCKLTWRGIGILTLMTVLVCPVAFAQQATPGEKAAAGRTIESDLSFITPGAFMATVSYPRRVLTSPESELLPIEIITALGQKELNIDPLDIEQILMIAELPKDSPTLVAGCVIRFSRPYDRDSILPALRKESTPGLLPSLVKPSPAAMVPSMLYRRANGPKGYSFAMPDDRTLLMAPDEMLQRMVAQKKKHTVGPLSRALKGADFSDDSMIFVAFEPLRSAIKKASEEARISPKYRQQVELWQEVPDLISLTELRLSVVGSKHRFLLSIHTIDEASTVKLQRLINKILDLGEQTTLAEAAEQAARNPDSNSPTHQALRQYSERTTKQMFNALRPVRRGDRLEIGTKGPHVNPLTVGLVLGSIGSYVKMGMLAQEQREKTRDNDS